MDMITRTIRRVAFRLAACAVAAGLLWPGVVRAEGEPPAPAVLAAVEPVADSAEPASPEAAVGEGSLLLPQRAVAEPTAAALAAVPVLEPAAAPALPAPASAPGETSVVAPPAVAAEPDPQAEGAEPALELVGPDDDRLMEEVEKRTTIAPAEPAIRIAEPSYDIPMELNAKVLDYVEIFQTTRRRNFEQGLVRSRKYEAMMKPIFAEYGIPTDLYYLALIESAFNPRAYSYAKAMGIWQFIASTGKIYGLRRTDYVDERCDPEKATRAAARHLRDLYADLGSWPLVLAAYNAGQGRVQRDIARAGTNDFWSLPLPAQTRNYVPAFFAAVIIAKDPERYGFQPEYETAPETETVRVGGGTRLSLVAALCHTSVDEIRTLNPELRRTTVPPGGAYDLKIPAGRGADLVAGLAKVPPGRATAGLTGYKVAPGDTLFSIAQRFGTTAEAIREANRMKGSSLRIGEQLSIPGQRVAAAPIPRAPGRVVVSSAVPTSYRVKAGDSPWSIARRFNLPLEDLLAWNGLETDAVLALGRTLALREPGTGDTRTAARGGRNWYEVKKGDNLWEISRKFSASVEELRRLNGFKPSHRLQIGDRVRIPEM